MRMTRWMLATLAVLAAAGTLHAGELGDQAPALAVSEWVKGEPVNVAKADGKHFYVVEFWATW